jgi:hypothetical protein
MLESASDSNIDSSVNADLNTNACNYIFRHIDCPQVKDRTVITADSKANKTASICNGVFLVSFVLLSLLTSSTSRPSSTEPPSTFRSKKL